MPIIKIFSLLLFFFCWVGCSNDSTSASDDLNSSSEEELLEDSSSSMNGISENGGNKDFSSSSTKGNSSCSSGGGQSEDGNSSGNEKESSSSKQREIAFQIKGGFYPEPISLQPPTLTNGGLVRCAFDGSVPTSKSEEFNEEKNIDHNTVVRCVVFDGDVPRDTVTETYFIGESVKMPVVAISVSPEFFARNYINTTFCEGGNPSYCPPGLMEDYEHPIHVEYFAEGSASKSKAFEVNAGISLMGNYSRTYLKKSVSISMRKEYQDGRIKYPLFATRPQSQKFKAFILRNNGNRFVGDYIEDAMASSLLEGSGVDYQRSRQVVVFYNGKYYGIHDMREKLNEHFVETNYGIDSKGVDFIKHVGETITASGGSADGYISMLEYIASHDFKGENNANYAYIKTVMDVGNYADYMAAQMYYKNGDWPNNNVRAWRSAEQPWKFVVFDLDHGFGWDWCAEGFSYYYPANGYSMSTWVSQGGKSLNNTCYGKSSALCFHNIYNKLMTNPDFSRLFKNHAAVMYENFLNATMVSTSVNAITGTIDAVEIARDQQRFPRDYGHVFDVTGNSLISWASTRDSYAWKDISSAGTISVTLKSKGAGKVLLDGMNLPKGTASSTNYTGKFFDGNAMELTAVPAAGATFVGWSDGNTENPRLVIPEDNDVFEANFK